MCIVLFAWQTRPDYPLVVAANRDEFHHRPAEPARWRGDLLCGLDLASGGTWLGATRSGRFAAVTNYREPIQDRTPGTRSRGMLPLGFLESERSPRDWLAQLLPEQDQYGAFNLLVCDGRELWYAGNRHAPPRPVSPGIHALSNGRLDTEWPKTRRGRELLAHVLAEGAGLDRLLSILADRQEPPDDQLPDTGVGLELERLVAPIFVQSATYGTRCSTAFRQGADGTFELAEQRWQPAGGAEGEAQHFTSTSL